MSQASPAADDVAPAVRERVFSGIQPSGASHLGNYLGAQANYVKLQDEYETIYAIVDLHALTTVHDGAQLRTLTHEMVLDLLAVGLDPKRCALIRQCVQASLGHADTDRNVDTRWTQMVAHSRT